MSWMMDLIQMTFFFLNIFFDLFSFPMIAILIKY